MSYLQFHNQIHLMFVFKSFQELDYVWMFQPGSKTKEIVSSGRQGLDLLLKQNLITIFSSEKNIRNKLSDIVIPTIQCWNSTEQQKLRKVVQSVE